MRASGAARAARARRRCARCSTRGEPVQADPRAHHAAPRSTSASIDAGDPRGRAERGDRSPTPAALRDRVVPRARARSSRRASAPTPRRRWQRRGRPRARRAPAHRRRRAAPASSTARALDTEFAALAPTAQRLRELVAEHRTRSAHAAVPRRARRRRARGDRRPDRGCSTALLEIGERGPLDPALQGPRRDEPGPARRHHDEPGLAHAAPGARRRTTSRPTTSSRTLMGDDVEPRRDVHRAERARRAEPGRLAWPTAPRSDRTARAARAAARRGAPPDAELAAREHRGRGPRARSSTTRCR